VWNIGNGTPRFVESDESRGVVQRRELRQRVELALDRFVDDDRSAETQTTVDDPMRNRVDVRRYRLE
jgi:hypothetical protein